MDPEVWGPKLWFVIHTFALNYPNNPNYEDKRVMEEFFNNLKYIVFLVISVGFIIDNALKEILL